MKISSLVMRAHFCLTLPSFEVLSLTATNSVQACGDRAESFCFYKGTHYSYASLIGGRDMTSHSEARVDSGEGKLVCQPPPQYIGDSLFICSLILLAELPVCVIAMEKLVPVFPPPLLPRCRVDDSQFVGISRVLQNPFVAYLFFNY